MKTIELTKGYVALIDEADYERVNAFKWYAHPDRRADGTVYTFYAARRVVLAGKDTAIFMHRFIMGITDPRVKVDHKNHNGIDNQRSNLRVATQAQNRANSRIRSDNSSGVKGVSWNKSRSKWQVQIKSGGKDKFLGRFDSLDEAASAYKNAAEKTFGEFAYAAKEETCPN